MNVTTNTLEMPDDGNAPLRQLARRTETMEELSRPLRQVLRKHRRSISDSSIPICSCRLYLRKHQECRIWGWSPFQFPVITQEVTDHLPSCRYFSQADFSRTVEASFQVALTSAWGYCVKAGWLYARRSGWATISPVLSYRAVVPHNSPGFKPFIDLQRTMSSYYGSNSSKMQWAALLFQALFEVKESFRQHRAGPTDVLEGGSGIYAVS